MYCERNARNDVGSEDDYASYTTEGARTSFHRQASNSGDELANPLEEELPCTA